MGVTRNPASLFGAENENPPPRVDSKAGRFGLRGQHPMTQIHSRLDHIKEGFALLRLHKQKRPVTEKVTSRLLCHAVWSQPDKASE